MDALIAAALEVNQAQLALGHEVFEVPGASFVRARAHPDIWDANLINTVTARTSGEIDALLARADQASDGSRHLRFDVDPRTPPEFEARLILDGWRMHSQHLVMLLEGLLQGDPPSFRIELAARDADRAAFATLQSLDWAEGAPEARDPATGSSMATTMRAKSPPMRCWLGYTDGVPRGYLWSWEGFGGIGQVESLFVHPDYRHRGLATALLHHAVRDAHALGAGPIVIVADAADTPKAMYAAMGWHPVALKRAYIRSQPATLAPEPVR